METTLLPDQLAPIVDNIISGIFVFAIDDSRALIPFYINEGMYRMLGYKYSELDRMLKDVRRVIIPDDMARFEQALDDVLKDDGAVEVEFRTVTGDGNVRWLQVRANLYGKMDGYKLIAGVVFDATDRKEIELELALQAERNSILLESAKEHLLDYNVRTDVLNMKFENSDVFHGEMVIKDFVSGHDFEAIHEEDRGFMREMFSAAMKSKLTDSVEFRSEYLDGDKKCHWYRLTLTSVRGVDGYITRIVGRVVNIDDKKKKEQELEMRADKDSLTGLYNKGTATTLISQAIEKCAENRSAAAMIMVDLDHFKSVNDTFGHSAGDMVIEETGRTLNDTFKGHDIVGRMGGDEFMIFMDDIKGPDDALLIAKKLNLILCRNMQEEAGHVFVTASIGIAMMDETISDFKTLYNLADKALYITKESGRNGRTIICGGEITTYR